MPKKQFDGIMSKWKPVVEKEGRTVFSEIQKAKKQIEKLLEQPTDSEQSQLHTLSQEERSKLRPILEYINSEMKKHIDFKYYFDDNTKILCEDIQDNKKSSELNGNRLKVLQIFQNLSKSPDVPEWHEKLHKLQKLLAKADQRIQKQEARLIKPLKLVEKTKEAYTEFAREINFFLIVAWIISFLLANKDPSTCLDKEIVGAMNFRQWLWANGGITLFLSIVLVVWDMFFDDQDEKKQSEEDADEQQKLKKSKPKEQKQTSFCSTFFQIILGIGMLSKFIWIFFGIILFLNQVNFNQCEDNVLNYCSLEFLAFFSFTIIAVISFLLKCIKQRFKREIKSYPSSEQLKKKNENPSQQKLQPKERELSLSIEGNQDDLQDILKRVVVWSLIGWVYDFVLFRKDQSACLDQRYEKISITYRDWLLIDGITSLITFVLTILLIIVFIVRRQHFMIWQVKEDFFKINMNWVRNNMIFVIVFGLILIFKMAWMVVGIVLLCLKVDLSNQKCSGNVPNFLVAYFTESVYVIINTILCVVKGYRKRKMMQDQPRGSEERTRRKEDNKKNAFQISEMPVSENRLGLDMGIHKIRQQQISIQEIHGHIIIHS